MPTSSREHAVPQQRADSGSAEAALPTGTVTFLFTDIEGSTALLRAAGESYGDLLAEHRRLLREAFAAHAGREVDTQGDSFFVAFAGPAQAVSAAVDAQRALAVHPWAPGCAVRVPRTGRREVRPLVPPRAAPCAVPNSRPRMLMRQSIPISPDE